MHKPKNTKSAGFGAVEIVIAVVVVLVVGFIGWRLYDALKSKQTNPSQQTNSNPTTDTAKYLDIKELGVKIKLDDKTQDVTYYSQMSNGMPTALLSTTSLVDKAGSVCDAKTSWPLGTIEKSQSLTMPWGVTLSVNNTNVFQVGGSYFIYTTPNQPCTSNKAASDLETAQLASFKEALKTIQLDR